MYLKSQADMECYAYSQRRVIFFDSVISFSEIARTSTVGVDLSSSAGMHSSSPVMGG